MLLYGKKTLLTMSLPEKLHISSELKILRSNQASIGHMIADAADIQSFSTLGLMAFRFWQ